MIAEYVNIGSLVVSTLIASMFFYVGHSLKHLRKKDLLIIVTGFYTIVFFIGKYLLMYNVKELTTLVSAYFLALIIYLFYAKKKGRKK